MKKFTIRQNRNRGVYWSVITSVALSWGGKALGQTNAVVTPESVTNNVGQLGETTVVGKLDTARNQILPDLGATAYNISKEQIQSLPQGANAPMTQVILRAPGVAQDNEASGALHVRGEHANLQYRINDVLLPEGITGFGLELDPRFVESMQLITGSLPAQYGFRTAGVVDIKTKSGAFENGGAAEMYGGSYDTIRPSFEYGGSEGKFSYFMDGSYDHNALGIENPTSSHDAIHDTTDQGKLFSYLSYILDDSSRVSLMLSASDSQFQVPNTPGVPVGTSPDGSTPWNFAGSGLPATFNSVNLDEKQNEQNYYVVATYQKSAGDLNFQISAFGRDSSVHFMPDIVGDLFFDGVASDVKRELYSGGLQGDGSYALGDKHTIRAGFSVLDEAVSENSTTTVFPVDGSGNPTGPAFPIMDKSILHGLFAGLYLQDEWKIVPELTLNYGGRFDVFRSTFDNETQFSPRVNLIYQPTDSTTLHAGYSHYFTPPPVESVSGSTLAQFVGTSNDAGTTDNSRVRAERADYFDAGISQKLAPGLTVGLDGYYKRAKQQLDDGLFGQTLILSAFNYEKGEIYGLELTASYNKGGFSAFANLAYSVAKGQNWDSAQFLFGPAGPGTDRDYVQNHWISLDHDQTLSGSFGAAYTWIESARNSTRVYVDALYGSGLRTDGGGTEDGTPAGNPIPNGATVPSYYSVSLGAEQSIKLSGKRMLKARLDIVNVTDNSYMLRNGSGVGVNAASFGERLGVFGSLTFVF